MSLVPKRQPLTGIILVFVVWSSQPVAAQVSPVAEAQRHNREGLRLFQQGSFVPALQEFQAAMAANPSEAEYPNNAGICYLNLGQYAQARVQFDKALQLKELPLYRFNSGLALMQMGQLPQALGAFRRAVELNPDYPEPWNYIGIVEYRQRNFAKAKEAWLRTAQLVDNPEVQTNLGMVNLELGQLDDSRRHLQQALQQNPRHGPAHYNLGVLFQRQQHWSHAEQSYRLAIQIDPQAFAAHYNLAIVQTAQGKKQEAIASLENFLRVCPPSMGQQIADARRRIEALRRQ